MRPRIQRYRHAKPPGRRFENIKQGCSWCERGEDPAPGQEICQGCVVKFKVKLTSYRWRQARAAFLTIPGNAYCACGCERLAEVIDHEQPWRFFPSLFWDNKNWRPLTQDCNKRKGVEDNRKYRSV